MTSQDRKFVEASAEPVTIWVRNGSGFAFQYEVKKREAEAWNKTRIESIRSVESDRGWTRYIDPCIPLYIVPSSPDVDAFMHHCIVLAMGYLDMPSNAIGVHSNVTKSKEAAKIFFQLHAALFAKPDCATSKIHLIHREDLDPNMKKVRVMCDLSSFYRFLRDIHTPPARPLTLRPL